MVQPSVAHSWGAGERTAQCGLKAENCPVKMAVCGEKQCSEDEATVEESGLKQWGSNSG